VGVVISGGHCNIYSCRGLNEFEIIGRTRDDAAGEAFDKVAKMMGLGYPGGPIIEKYALEYEDKQTVPFPRAMLDDPDSLDFSFSGLKTAVLYYWKSTGGTKDDIRRICSSFQTAVADVIAKKIERSLRITGYDTIAFGGGVMNNRHIRKIISSLCNSKDVELYMAEKDFCADNAAMVAITADILYNDTMPIDVY
jgi:N6-L-threonylcarbamoyladenine synthase